MRTLLSGRKDERKRFRGTFVRLGKKSGYKGNSEETVLITNIIDLESNTVVADHLWFTFTKGFQELNLQPGNIVEFDARVKEYKKGYAYDVATRTQRKTDYKLSHPTKITLVR